MSKNNKPVVPEKPRGNEYNPSFEISSDKVLIIKSGKNEIVIPLLSIIKIEDHQVSKNNGKLCKVFLVTYKIATFEKFSKNIVEEEHTIEVSESIFNDLSDELFSNYNFDDAEWG